jgi:N-methylhydantoinase A
MVQALQTPLRIGVDVGGTFTDLVVLDAGGAVHAFKSPSNPSDPAAGVLAAVALAAERLGWTPEDLLRACGLFVHGSTIATNTLLEKKGACVGLLVTQGFRDSLEIRRGIRRDVWDHRAPFPPVLVPRYLRLPVTGRLDAHGNELVPLDARTVRDAVATFRAEGVRSIAICLLHSYANPLHEHQAASVVRQLWPEIPVSCSADVAPIIGEYERTSTVVVNAYVAPRVVPYLRALDERLAALGLRHGVLLVQSNGGTISVGELADRPVQLVLSGPAAGVGAIAFFGRDTGSERLVSIEVGGTSCDVTLSADGIVAMADQVEVDDYHLSVPAVEIHTVGAGGGTIARVDAARLLHAGPQGAGARPGPAAYGLGGGKPTVNDAQLVLGRLKPGAYAGGAITLDLARAQTAIMEHVAAPLGIGMEAAAAGILRLVEQNIQHAVERVSIERGYNPRGFTLIAAGGAGPLHGAPVARALGCKAAYIPRLAGVFCAFGMCNADIRHDHLRAWLRDLDEPGGQAATTDAFATMTAAAMPVLAREGFAGDAAICRKGLDLRYVGQQWSVAVETESLDPLVIRRAFEAEHTRLYGYAQPNGQIEVVNLRLTAIGKTPPLHVRPPAPDNAVPVPSETRLVWIDEARGMQPTPVYDGTALRPGQTLLGPAIIDEATTTILVGVADRLRVTDAANYLIEL